LPASARLRRGIGSFYRFAHSRLLRCSLCLDAQSYTAPHSRARVQLVARAATRATLQVHFARSRTAHGCLPAAHVLHTAFLRASRSDSSIGQPLVHNAAHSRWHVSRLRARLLFTSTVCRCAHQHQHLTSSFYYFVYHHASRCLAYIRFLVPRAAGSGTTGSSCYYSLHSDHGYARCAHL